MAAKALSGGPPVRSTSTCSFTTTLSSTRHGLRCRKTMAFRRFVLATAAEMLPPGWGASDHRLDHRGAARPPRSVTALCSGDRLARHRPTRLAQALVQQLGGQLLPDRASAAERIPGDDDDKGLHADELAIIHERAAFFDEENLPDDGSLVASPYWFDESLAYAELYDSESDREHLKEALLRLRGSVARPRLVVFLDPPLDYLLDCAGRFDGAVEKLTSAAAPRTLESVPRARCRTDAACRVDRSVPGARRSDRRRPGNVRSGNVGLSAR